MKFFLKTTFMNTWKYSSWSFLSGLQARHNVIFGPSQTIQFQPLQVNFLLNEWICWGERNGCSWERTEGYECISSFQETYTLGLICFSDEIGCTLDYCKQFAFDHGVARFSYNERYHCTLCDYDAQIVKETEIWDIPGWAVYTLECPQIKPSQNSKYRKHLHFRYYIKYWRWYAIFTCQGYSLSKKSDFVFRQIEWNFG